LIRPWKSRLALLYVRGRGSVGLDLRIIWLTVLTIAARPRALPGVARLVRELGGGEELALVALREQPLREAPPPGETAVVASLEA
jgi:hypothetical protein